MAMNREQQVRMAASFQALRTRTAIATMDMAEAADALTACWQELQLVHKMAAIERGDESGWTPKDPTP